MQSKELLKIAINTAYGITLPLLEDMADTPMTFPTANGGNHPTWIVGHLAYSTGGVIWGVMQGKENPLAEWKDLFAGGTEPQGDAEKYPPYDQLLAKFQEMHNETLELLESMSEEDLDQPSKQCPEGREGFFGTYRQCFLAMAIHLSNHRGQISDCRRSLERKPLLA